MAASDGAWKMNLNVNVDGALKKQEDVKKFDPSPLLHAINDVTPRASGILVEGYASAYEEIKSVSCEVFINEMLYTRASATSEVAIGLLQSPGTEYKPTAMESQELSNLVKDIKNIRSTLASEMESRKKHIETINLADDYEYLVGLFKREHTDNIEILKALLCWSQSQSTSIYNCSTKTQEELNKLSGKHVLLYFSNLGHLSEEEISFLSEKYAKKLTPCEIVWVPIVDESTSWNEEIGKRFKKMRDSMGWYSINDPWKLNKAVIKYTKEEWKFEGKSEFVVLNPKGEFVISAAVNLFWFLERSGFKVNYWKTIQLLEETMGSTVNDWISADKHIILFGGNDKEWIKKFVGEARRVAEAAKIDFVMMYAGKSDLKWVDHRSILEQLQKVDTIGVTPRTTGPVTTPIDNAVAVSGFGDQKLISSFWATLQSIWLTKTKTGKSIVDTSSMDDIVTLLTFDASGEGWAAICRGSRPGMAKARGNTILDTLKNYSQWEDLAKRVGFANALVQTIPDVKTTEGGHDCYNLEVAATTGSTPQKVNCRLCERAMKTFIAYRCCGDH